MHRIILIVALSALLSAGRSPPLRAGSWTTRTAPTGATLDGRPLGDLPYSGGAGPGSYCLTPAQAEHPGAMLTDGLDKGCTFTREVVAGGRITIEGTCPPQAPGLARGSVRIAGTYTARSYIASFATTNASENGVMGFTGTMSGTWAGACTAPGPTPPTR